MRWILYLQSYRQRMVIKHIPGPKNVSDLPSRIAHWNREVEAEVDAKVLDKYERADFPFRIEHGEGNTIFRPRAAADAEKATVAAGDISEIDVGATRVRKARINDHCVRCRGFGCNRKSCDPSGELRNARDAREVTARKEREAVGRAETRPAPDTGAASDHTSKPAAKPAGKRVGKVDSEWSPPVFHIPTAEEVRNLQIRELPGAVKALEDGSNESSELPGVKLRWVLHGSHRLLAVAFGDGYKVVLPPSLRDNVFDLSHSIPMGGHFGINETLRSVRRHYWWPELASDVEKRVKACPPCQRQRLNDRRQHTPRTRRELIEPFTNVHLDVYGMLHPSEDGDKFVLAMTDAFSGLVVFEPLKEKSAAVVAEAVVRRWFCSEKGTPVQLFADAGPEFVNDLMRGMCNELWVDIITAAVDRQRANGPVEAQQRRMGELLRKTCEERHELWSSILPQVAWALNTAVNGRTGDTPFRVCYGRDPRFIFDALSQTSATARHERRTPYQHGRWVASQFAAAAKIVRASQRKHLAGKESTPAGVRVSRFAPGDLVWRANPKGSQHAKGTDPQRQIGPYKLVQDVSPHGTRDEWRVYNPRTQRHSVLLAESLRPYLRQGRLGDKYNLRTTPDTEDDHDSFCFKCGEGGTLNMCSGCPSVAHTACVSESEGSDWLCPWCQRQLSGVDERTPLVSRVPRT